MLKFRPCSIAGCDGNSHYSASGAKGLCTAHYRRNKRHGAPELGRIVVGTAMKWIYANAAHDGEGCLIWPFSSFPSNYGRVSYNGRERVATGVMCEIAHGPRPSDFHECAHSCGKGNDGCIHPKHLRWATKKENFADKIVHGTTNRGERHYRAHLSADQVRRIRALQGEVSQRSLAEMFSVSKSAISGICSRANWAWLD